MNIALIATHSYSETFFAVLLFSSPFLVICPKLPTVDPSTALPASAFVAWVAALAGLVVTTHAPTYMSSFGLVHWSIGPLKMPSPSFLSGHVESPHVKMKRTME